MAKSNLSALVGQWPTSAQLAYRDALARGLNPQQATDFASAQYGESGFNPNAVNKSSGAAGLYQLLSSGYVNKANQLGGVFNPQANIEAILPNYAGYYQSHPGAVVPGAAASAVEASGEPASYYAQGYQHLAGAQNIPAQVSGPETASVPAQGLTAPPSGSPGPSPAPVLSQAAQAAQSVSSLGQQFALHLVNSAQQMLDGGTPNLSQLFAAAKGFQQAKAQLAKTQAPPKTAPLGPGTHLAMGAAKG